MIEARGLCAHAGRFTLKDVTFALPSGAHALVTGPTASGKTTLLELLAGAITPDTGDLRMNGESVVHSRPEHRDIGFVPQHGFLFPHLSVHDNVAYGARGHGGIHELAARFRISDLMTRGVSSLSGGERQLVALCRALATGAPFLFMDEPFSALDDSRRGETLRELARMQSQRNLTIVHVTHHASDDPLATHRLRMHEGRLTGDTALS